MPWSYQKIVNAFEERPSWVGLLKYSLQGIEREVLRVDENGDIAQTPHPRYFGSALTHPYITTDFSEAQLELVTPTFDTEAGALGFLHKLHHVVHQGIPNEYLWPCSSPCPLPDEENIPVGYYGHSQEGRNRRLYRLGLIQRYGAKVQTLSGIHYNFSFHPDVWKELKQLFRPTADDKHWVSEVYLRMARNFLRMGWLNTYLFGCTPAVDKSFLDKGHPLLGQLKDGSYFGEHATSIRLSDLGYFGKVQQQCVISLNHLNEYVNDLKAATSTPHPEYEKLAQFIGGEPQQLNSNVLQTMSEYYARIRPKARFEDRSHPLDSLAKHGIAYLEVRAVDINPFNADGCLLGQFVFLHTFLIYALFKESPEISREQRVALTANQNKIALFGRDPKVTLNRDGKEVLFRDWAAEILDEMAPVARFLDVALETDVYTRSLSRQVDKLKDSEETASARILRSLQNDFDSYRDFGMHWAKKHKADFMEHQLTDDVKEEFAKLAEKSLLEQEQLEEQTASRSPH